MPRLIDADKLMQIIPTEEYNARMAIAYAPTVDAEPTEEQVKEYCRKRCLVIVNSELFNEMKARWSAEPIRHGHIIYREHHRINYGKYTGIDQNGEEHTITVCEDYGSGKEPYCSECGSQLAESFLNYCPKCGAKMDEVEE